MGVFLPALCVRSFYKIRAGAPFPHKNVFRRTTLFMHALMFLIAYFTWRSFHIPMFPRAAIGWKEIGYGFATLILFLVVMIPF